MGILKRIRTGAQQAVAKVKSLFTRKPKQAAPPPPKTPRQKREADRISAESEANKRAIWAIQNAMQNPQDKTAQEGRRKAVEYLSRQERLKKNGPLQDWNRTQMAERWNRSELSTQEGQQARKDRKLDIFNSNFNMDLSQEQADTVADLMETDSYQQLCETYRGIYGDIIQAMGEAIEEGTDPQRLQSSLQLFVDYGLEPDFDTFKQVLDLPSEDYYLMSGQMEEASQGLFYQNNDEMGRQQQMEGILGQYIDWK